MLIGVVVYLVLMLVLIDTFYLIHLVQYILYGFQDLIINQGYVVLHPHQLTVLCPKRAKAIPKLDVVVVLPTPPFPEVITITRAIIIIVFQLLINY